jgi:phosphohistidine phosphatase SixA
LRYWFIGAVATIAAMTFAPVKAQQMQGRALIDALKGGGYILVMRHANSPAMPPSREDADPENTELERQLDATGKESAHTMGAAFKSIGIPVGEVLSSPTYRARLTVQLAAFGTPKILNDLDEGAAGMAANAEKAKADFLRTKSMEAPRPGTNTVLVSHAPNIQAAFGTDAQGVASGESLIFRPAAGKATLVARVKIYEWTAMVKK